MSDSAQARFSTFEIPGLMMTPVPHGADSAADRAQLNDHYAGILAQAPKATNETCWTPANRNASPWTNVKALSGAWKSERSQTKIWTPEKEVVPC